MPGEEENGEFDWEFFLQVVSLFGRPTYESVLMSCFVLQKTGQKRPF